MYALMNSNWEVDGLYSDIKMAYIEMRQSPFALTLINNVTGAVICNNFDWKYYND